MNSYKIILASKSPRRQHLLRELGLSFEIRTKDTDETFPEQLKAEQIPLYLAHKKAEALKVDLKDGELLITADTIVWINNQVLNKPVDHADATRMLRILSGNMHQVFTGVCLTSVEKTVAFYGETKVYFKDLTDTEIDHYIRHSKPFDKAGAYGAQDWIGLVGVRRMEGTYFNVMGLPMFELYTELQKF
ncbi:MAG TPA: Maf family nucleotide pyrophosphatase [Bacteroidia bacterium]|jgi:septum formation protein|nr:Maf family nucleotide pyrophosphatase [Bacteroidia bacterium]